MFIIIGQIRGKIRVARKHNGEVVKNGFHKVEEARDWIKKYGCGCGNLLFEGPRNGCQEAHLDTGEKEFSF